MQWLAGKTHKLAANNWSMRSMGRAINCLEKALVEIEKDSAKFLEDKFMINIFNEFTGTIPKFNTWNKYMLEDKVTPAIDKMGSNIGDYNDSKHIIFDLVVVELFYPEQPEKKKHTIVVFKMAKGLTVTALRELQDPHKQTHNYLSSVDGEFS